VNGEIPQLKTNLSILKGASLIGVDARQFSLHEPEVVVANWRELSDLQQRFGFRPHIGQRYAFEDFEAAMRATSSTNVIGRVVLQMG
jgi:NADPH:quinone reductase